jgi:3-hydroxymyristoyl/3-hydroxydecanoyl-(acyl carrier protein) dehydratase
MSFEHEIEPRVLACRRTAEGVELDLHIGADLAPLRGHFPEQPIVPGVCLLDWVVRYAIRHLARLEAGATRFQVKFRRVIRPGTDVTLSLRHASGGRVQFEYRGADAVYATGTVSSGEA